jgi:putative transposase
MPKSTFVELPPEEQRQIWAVVRRARYGYLLALHILLLCAAGRTPTMSAAVLFCSRSSGYRTVRAYQEGPLGLEHADEGRLLPPVRTPVLVPTLRRSLVALRKAPPRAYGWCRTRWSCATLALTLQAQRGLTISAETLRRWLHEIGWVWKRAKRMANDDDPHRVERLTRIRFVYEQLRLGEALVCADELDIQVLPKVGDAWMLKGTQVEVMTPGTNDKHYLAGALHLATGTRPHTVGPRKPNALFRDLLQSLEAAYPAVQYQRLYVVVDNYKIQKAKAVAEWVAHHPRVQLLFLPTYCPRAHPIERALGDVHELCPRNHTRQRWRDLVADVEHHLQLNGPWQYQRSDLYDAPAVTAALARMPMEQTLAAAG